LKIDPGSPVELTTDGRTMTITPVNAEHREEKVRAARKKVNSRYGQVFKKLAE